MALFIYYCSLVAGRYPLHPRVRIASFRRYNLERIARKSSPWKVSNSILHLNRLRESSAEIPCVESSKTCKLRTDYEGEKFDWMPKSTPD